MNKYYVFILQLKNNVYSSTDFIFMKEYELYLPPYSSLISVSETVNLIIIMFVFYIEIVMLNCII